MKKRIAELFNKLEGQDYLDSHGHQIDYRTLDELMDDQQDYQESNDTDYLNGIEQQLLELVGRD